MNTCPSTGPFKAKLCQIRQGSGCLGLIPEYYVSEILKSKCPWINVKVLISSYQTEFCLGLFPHYSTEKQKVSFHIFRAGKWNKAHKDASQEKRISFCISGPENFSDPVSL